RKVDHALPNTIALGVLNRQSDCTFVGVEQIDALCPLKFSYDRKETGAAPYVNYGLITQIRDVRGKQQGVRRYRPDVVAKTQYHFVRTDFVGLYHLSPCFSSRPSAVTSRLILFTSERF